MSEYAGFGIIIKYLDQYIFSITEHSLLFTNKYTLIEHSVINAMVKYLPV